MKYRAKSHLYRPTGGSKTLMFGLVGTRRRKSAKRRRNEKRRRKEATAAQIRNHEDFVARAQQALLALRRRVGK